MSDRSRRVSARKHSVARSRLASSVARHTPASDVEMLNEIRARIGDGADPVRNEIYARMLARSRLVAENTLTELRALDGWRPIPAREGVTDGDTPSGAGPTLRGDTPASPRLVASAEVDGRS